MIATLVLAAVGALPLGVWPETTGPALTTIDDVEFYLAEPDDDYSIIAIQPISPPLAKADSRALRRLAATAQRLGADAVLLLGELPESRIPEDTDEPLPTTGRYATAVFVSFDSGDADQAPQKARQRSRRQAHHPRGPGEHPLTASCLEQFRVRR